MGKKQGSQSTNRVEKLLGNLPNKKLLEFVQSSPYQLSEEEILSLLKFFESQVSLRDDYGSMERTFSGYVAYVPWEKYDNCKAYAAGCSPNLLRVLLKYREVCRVNDNLEYPKIVAAILDRASSDTCVSSIDENKMSKELFEVFLGFVKNNSNNLAREVIKEVIGFQKAKEIGLIWELPFENVAIGLFSLLSSEDKRKFVETKWLTKEVFSEKKRIKYESLFLSKKVLALGRKM